MGLYTSGHGEVDIGELRAFNAQNIHEWIPGCKLCCAEGGTSNEEAGRTIDRSCLSLLAWLVGPGQKEVGDKSEVGPGTKDGKLMKLHRKRKHGLYFICIWFRGTIQYM